MSQLLVEHVDESKIQSSSLFNIFNVKDEAILDYEISLRSNLEYRLLIKKIILFIIVCESEFLDGKVSEIISDQDFIKSLFEMKPDIERLKVILKFIMDDRVLKTDEEYLRHNLIPYDELKSHYLKLVDQNKNGKIDDTHFDQFNDAKFFYEKYTDNTNIKMNINSYWIGSPVNLSFYDLDDSKIKVVTIKDTSKFYYRYRITEGKSFAPISHFTIKEGDYLIMFNNNGIHIPSYSSSNRTFNEFYDKIKNLERTILIQVEEIFGSMSSFKTSDDVLNDSINNVYNPFNNNGSKSNSFDINNVKFIYYDHMGNYNVSTTRFSKEDQCYYYSIKSPVGMRFFDLDTGLFYTVNTYSPTTAYYKYNHVNNKFVPIEYFDVTDGDYLISFSINGINTDTEEGNRKYSELEVKMKNIILSIFS